MTLRQKTLIIVLVTFTVLIVILYGVTRNILLDNFSKLEEHATRRDVERAVSTLSYDISTLNTTASDWAGWDDTYNFIEDGNEGYLLQNLVVESTYTVNRLNLLLLIDASGRIVFGKGFDLDNKNEQPVPIDFLQKHIFTNSPLLSHSDTESSASGIVLLPEGPMLVASRPIVTSERKGPIRGTLIMGRYLDSSEIARLGEITHLSLTVQQSNDTERLPDFQTAQSFLSEDAPILVRPLNENTVAGYTFIKDIYGKPILLLRADTSREIFQQGKTSVVYFILSFIAVGLIFSVVILLLLEKVILYRLARLSACVSNIGANSDFSARVQVLGKDELSSLAGSINGMLEAVEKSRSKLRESEEKYRLVFENSPLGLLHFNSTGTITACNDQLVKIIGSSKGAITGQNMLSLPDKKMVDAVKQALSGVQSHYEGSYHATTSGKVISLKADFAPIIIKDNTAIGAVCIVEDITKRKMHEEQLKYLSLHDSLTGLYNRVYFEQEMRRLEVGRCFPVGMIVCDVDGLKLVNDTLGHDKGDALLVAAADVIMEAFRESDVVARIGGDEFAVLLPNSPRDVIERAFRRIRDAAERHNEAKPELPLSISIGFAVSNGKKTNMKELFKEADNNMYREKLHSSQSARSAIVNTLMKALEARDYITEGHAIRLQDLVISMAVSVGLPERRVTDLRLLAKFHDIGKVGVPDRILFKPGTLTSEEAAEMQRHCEIGHRIALSAPDLVHIADWILKHHERWDGNGYPLGLGGEEIPLECRILAIADAYDAMTSDRPYRQAITHREALAELRKCAGTQFDPQLVSKFKPS